MPLDWGTTMRNRILNYVKLIDTLIETESKKEKPFDGDATKANAAIKEHLTQISFFMHERLIHLIVTVLFALLTFIAFFYFMYSLNITIFVLTMALMVLLIPYIRHYYILENNVQYMYEQYDKMVEMRDEVCV